MLNALRFYKMNNDFSYFDTAIPLISFNLK
jgi:hypothetical protein